MHHHPLNQERALNLSILKVSGIEAGRGRRAERGTPPRCRRPGDADPPTLGFSGLRMGAQLPARLARTLSPGGPTALRALPRPDATRARNRIGPGGRSLYQLVLHRRPPAAWPASYARKKGGFPNVGNRRVLAGSRPLFQAQTNLFESPLTW